MLTDAHRQLLSKVEILAGLPTAALDKLWTGARVSRAATGSYLFQQGEAAEFVFVVISGRLRLVQHSSEGTDVTMFTFVEGDVIAVVVAIMESPYPGSCEVLADSEVLSIPRTLLWSLMEEYPVLTVRALKIVAARLYEAHERIRELSTERVQQRIARAILRLVRKAGIKQPDGSIKIDVRLSRQDLAQMTGTTLETVSRTLTVWNKDQLVSAGRESLTILKPHALMVIAEDLGDS